MVRSPGSSSSHKEGRRSLSALLQYFDEYAQALDWAYSNLALDSFFVKRVEPAELSTVHFTRDLA